MSGTNYIASNWRVPENSNSSKNDNYSLSFDGGTEELAWGQTNLGPNHSICFWVKVSTGSNGYRTILVDDGAYPAFTNPTRRIYVRQLDGKLHYVDGSSAGSTTATSNTSAYNTLTDGEWHHIAIVRADTVATIYIDGQDETLDSTLGAWTTPYYLTQTGYDITGFGGPMAGALSDISFFDYALDSSQVSTLYGDATSGAGNPMALKPTPVAYYPLGDNSSGNPLIQPNVSVDDASVFTFDGTNYIESSNISELNGSAVATWSCWIKRANATGGYYTMGTWGSAGTDRQMVLFQSSNLIRVLIGDGTIFDTAFEASLTADTEWHNIIIVYDGSLGNTSKVKLYYDTTPLTNTATGTNVTTLNTSANGFTIGALGTGTPGVNWFIGEISNVAIWDTDQTSEISNIYNNGIPATSYTNTPLAWYKLDQSANWEADTSGDWQIPDAVSAYPQSFSFTTTPQEITFSKIDLGINNTISCWVKRNNGSALTDLIFGDNTDPSNADIYINGNQRVYYRTPFVINFFFNVSGWDIINQADEWFHLAIVRTGDNATLYLNGDNKLTISGFGTSVSTFVSSIGGDGLRVMDGKLSNAQVWDVSLNDTEVETLYNNGTPLTTAIQSANLKGWWKLDDSAKSIYNNNGGFWTIEDGNITPTYTEGLFFGGGYIGGSPLVNYAGMRLTNQTISSGHVTNSFWWKLVKPTTGSSTAIVKTGGNLGEIKVTSSGVVQWVGDGAAKYINFGTNVGDGAWHHILVYYPNTTTIDHNDVRCFIDGSEATKTLIGGSSSTGPQTSIEGILQQSVPLNVIVSNWSYWLSDQTSNIDAIYNNGTPGDISSLSPDVWLKFDNATTSFNGVSGAEYGLATDSSGNSNDGDLSGKTSGIDVRLDTSNVQSNSGVSSGMTEQSLVNNNVSTLNGESSGMTSGNLVLSDLTRNLPYENYSLDFDSAGPDYIGASPTSISSTITVSAWIKTSTTGIQTIVNEDQAGGAGTRNWNLLLEPGNKIQVVIVNTDGTVNNKLRSTALEVQDGNWHHIVFTYDGTANVDGLKTYVDGGNLESFQTTSTGIITTDTLGVYIGSLQVTGAWPFSGNICNVSIFNEALTSTEVQKLYANGIPQDLTNFTPQPLHWWTLGKESFWNGSDWIVRDMIGSNDGTSANMAVNDLVGDAPRSEANGTGANMDIPTNLVGNAGFSDKNAYSINMSPSARVTDTP